MKHEIHLMEKFWIYDDRDMLGKAGGFGAVFKGEGLDGMPVAIKRLKRDAVGPVDREVELAGYFLGHGHPHVIGIYDVGRDDTTGEVFVVMERAQQSLQELVESDGPLASAAALEILDAIAAGLEEIGEVAHRDLKPANILLHQGVWKIADLGLARFLEASTAPVTMRDFLSFQYCAPEQLNAERPTKATDVYALGGIAYALLTGQPPFPGPTHVEYAYQHRFETPRRLDCISSLAQLASDCLLKSPANRPSLRSIRNRIQKIRESLGVSTPPSNIAEAARLLAEKKANEEAMLLRRQKTIDDRNLSAKEAKERLSGIFRRLFQSIAADAGEVSEELNLSQFEVGLAFIQMVVLPNNFSERLKCPLLNWDVLAAGGVTVLIRDPNILDVKGRATNLWFGRLSKNDGFRWWEVSFFPYDKIDVTPCALNFGDKVIELFDIDKVRAVLSADPIPIDGEGEEAFIERWKKYFGAAAMWEFNKVNPFNPPDQPKPISNEFYLED